MILMNHFKDEPKVLKDEMFAAVSRVIESGSYVLGNEVVSFEQAWAEVCAVPYAVGVGNGMDAIEIALRSLDIGPGDEVITTPMTAFATVLAILRAGATPVLADIDIETALLNSESVARCISAKTKAIILVHLYGHIRNMNFWINFCNQQNIYLIEDCAQSHLASLEGQVAGSFGVVGAYSFYPTKNLGALGDGGMIITKSSEIAEYSSRLRNYGQSVRYLHPDIGLNSRLDEIQAAILRVRLKWLPQFTRRRQEIALRYRQHIVNPMIHKLDDPQEPDAHVYHLYVITCDHRAELQEYLAGCGIQTTLHYPIPVHHQESCRDILCDPIGLSASECHAKTCISLPCHPQMSDDDISIVINALNYFVV
jgi:dTDP-4-amino-4,6-dideoxygalactose transaminase